MVLLDVGAAQSVVCIEWDFSPSSGAIWTLVTMSALVYSVWNRLSWVKSTTIYIQARAQSGQYASTKQCPFLPRPFATFTRITSYHPVDGLVLATTFLRFPSIRYEREGRRGRYQLLRILLFIRVATEGPRRAVNKHKLAQKVKVKSRKQNPTFLILFTVLLRGSSIVLYTLVHCKLQLYDTTETIYPRKVYTSVHQLISNN